MKNKKPLMALAVALLTAGLAAALAGCAPQQSGGEGGGEAAASSDSLPAGSLKATHPAGQLDNMDEFTNKLCLSCHSRETINAANENYANIEGFNPHKAHLAAGDCVTCHSVDATSTLTCNECHDAPLPDGWESAPRGSGPLHHLEPSA